MDKSHARACVVAEWAGMENAKKNANEQLVYENQMEKAIEIQSAFVDGALLVMFIASPQYGKTGCAQYLMYLMTTHSDDATMVHPDNVYIITGMSDKDWREQTKARMLPMFRERVYHRNDLYKITDEIKNKKGCLIVVDECHFGTEKNQTLHGCLKSAGLLDRNVLIEHDIKLLFVSATPGNVLVDAQGWGPMYQRTIIADYGTKYTSFKTLLHEDRVKHILNLADKKDVNELLDTIEKRWSTPRYHIIRASDIQLKNDVFKKEIIKRGYMTSLHNSRDRITKEQLDNMMNNQPAKHHFIFIKSFWRAAKTLNDAFIGVCHEKTNDYSVAAQGLAGRLLGYGKQHGDEAPLIYTNVIAIEEYVNWFNNKCNYYMSKKYTTTNLKVIKGLIKKKTDSTVYPPLVKNLHEVKMEHNKCTVSELIKHGYVKEVPSDALLVTQIKWYTLQAFKTEFGLVSIPAGAEELSKMMKNNGFDVNVSFTKNTAPSTSNMNNYYKKPEWAGGEYNVIKLKDDEVIVIKRNREVLDNLLKGQKIVVHTYQNRLALYEK